MSGNFEHLKIIVEKINNSIITRQDDLPIIITRYESLLEEVSYPNKHPNRIWHALCFKNASDKYVVAIRFGFASFDTFNCFMGHRRGTFIENFKSNSEYEFECIHEVNDAYAFKNFGTGFVYIDAIRNEFGEIWKADLQMIVEELGKLDPNVTIKDLIGNNKNSK